MIYRVTQINDPHLAATPPAGRTASYESDILAKLAWCIEHANYRQADAVVISGDAFHSKRASATPHLLVQRARAILNGAECPVYLIEGNHDQAHGGALDGQAILSLVGDNVRMLYGDAPDGVICGIPWDNRMEGPDGVAFLAGEIAACSAPLVFAHAPISLRPYPFGPEAQGWLLAADLVPLLPEHVRLVAHGHMHNGHHVDQWARDERAVNKRIDGIMWAYPDLTFSNPGALARATLSTDDVTRRPMVADITYDDATGTVEVRYVEVECARPAAEVLRIEQHAREAHRDGSVEALAASLAGAEAEVVDADVMRAHLRSLVRPETIAEDVWTRGLALADAALDGV